MGKAKRSKASRNQPYGNRQLNSVAALQKNFLIDLASLEESKRFKACGLLSNIYAINADNDFVLDKLTKPDILAKLSMRILDSSAAVRVEAARAVRHAAAARDETVVPRLINAGIFRTILTQIPDYGAHRATSAPVLEQSLYCVSNFISVSETCMAELAKSSVLQVCLQLLTEPVAPEQIALQLAASNLFLIATDSNQQISAHMTSNNISELLFQSISARHQAQAQAAPAVEGAPVPNVFDTQLLNVQVAGALLNVFTSIDFNEALAAQLHLTDLVGLLTSSLQPQLEGVQRLIEHYAAPVIAMDDQKLDAREEALEDVEEGIELEGKDQEVQRITSTKPEVPPTSTLDVVKTASELIANLGVQSCESEEADETVSAGQLHAIRVLQDHNTVVALSRAISDLSVPLVALCQGHSEKPLNKGFVELVEAVDRITTALTNLIASGVIRSCEVEGVFNILVDLIDFGVDAVNNTARSADKDGKEVLLWAMDSSLNSKHVVKAVAGLASSASNAMATLCKSTNFDAATNSQSHNIHLLAQHHHKMSVALVKGVTMPVMEIVVSNIESIGSLGEFPALPININAMLTNCLLRRLEEPAAFSYESSKTKTPAVCALQVLDAALNALIDLHSGDALEIFEVYIKMEVQTKLAAAVKRFSTLIRETSLSVSAEDLKRFKETSSNGKAFLQYKDDFSKTVPK